MLSYLISDFTPMQNNTWIYKSVALSFFTILFLVWAFGGKSDAGHNINTMDALTFLELNIPPNVENLVNSIEISENVIDVLVSIKIKLIFAF